MTDWYWREPLWLLLALMPWALLLLDRWQRRQRQLAWADAALHDWALATAHPASPSQRITKALRNGLLWLSIAIALAGPRIPQTPPEDWPAAWQAPHTPLILVLDVSRSMHADDIPPTRKRYALKVLKTWRQQHPQLRAGLVIYAGQAHTLLPATNDPGAWQDALDALPDLQMPSHGSNLAAAIELAHQNLKLAHASFPNNQANNAMPHTNTGAGGIVILTDADISDAQRQQSILALQRIHASNPTIQIGLLGIGGRASVPLSDGDGGWLTEAGNPVLTRLHSDTIKALTSTASWAENAQSQIAAPNKLPELKDLWQAPSTRLNAQQQQHIQWQELFPAFVILALLLIIAPIPIAGRGTGNLRKLRQPTSRSTQSKQSKPVTLHTSIALSGILLLVTGSIPQPLHAATPPGKLDAWRAWQSGDYRKAARLYANQSGWAARMGEGSSCYRMRDYPCAIQAYSRAARIANNDQQRSDAAYNLGNSYFHAGDFNAATALYKDVLRYHPKHQNASHNLAFSSAMQAAVARWQRQQPGTERTGRAGQGWRQRDIDPDQRIPPSANLSLGEKQNAGQTDNILQSLQDNSEFKQLLQAGIQHAKLAATGKPTAGQASRFIETDSQPINHDGNRTLWQRLFEMEEGYPAPLEQPKRLKGQRPW